MRKWIKNHTFFSALIVGLVLVTGYLLIGIWYMSLEGQDISISTDVENGIIIMDDSRVAVNGVCLPKIEQGEHLIEIEKDNNIIISQKVDIGDVSQKVLEEKKSDDSVSLEVKLDNCKNWNR